ncbi:MAG: hypothetical protein AAGF06_04195 [Pseudomonadota bacterium]
MKKLAIITLCTIVSACATAPALTPNDLNEKNSTATIKFFANSMKDKCLSEVKEDEAKKKKFCSCVEKNIRSNMNDKMTLSQVKQTLTGAAAGKRPVPNSRMVFAGVKQSCVAR